MGNIAQRRIVIVASETPLLLEGFSAETRHLGNTIEQHNLGFRGLGSQHQTAAAAFLTIDFWGKSLLQELLELNDYFGMEPEQVTLLKQEKVPCLADNAATLVSLNPKPYTLNPKP